MTHRAQNPFPIGGKSIRFRAHGFSEAISHPAACRFIEILFWFSVRINLNPFIMLIFHQITPFIATNHPLKC